MLYRELNDMFSVCLGEAILCHDEGVCTLLQGRFECALEILGLTHVEKLNLDTQLLRCPLCLLPLRDERRVTHVHEDCNSCNFWNYLSEEFDPFSR